MLKRARNYRVQRPWALATALLLCAGAFGPARAEEPQKPEADKAKAEAPAQDPGKTPAAAAAQDQKSPAEKPGDAAKPGDTPKPGEAKPAVRPLYRLRIGDEVYVEVEPQKEYTGALMVLPDGMIYIKNMPEIEAVGRTLKELEAAITKELEKTLVKPTVRVLIQKLSPEEIGGRIPYPADEKGETRGPGTGTGITPPTPISKITVVGAVQRSGPLELEGEQMRLRRAIDLAGGTSKDADLKNIVVRHENLSKLVVDLSTDENISNPAQNIYVRNGDSIEVPSVPQAATPRVRILGMVGNPGAYELKNGWTLDDLILAAGKLSILADYENVQLQREGKGRVAVNLMEQHEQGLDGQIRLMAGDEIYVPNFKQHVILLGATPGVGPRQLKEGTTIEQFFRTLTTDPAVREGQGDNQQFINIAAAWEKVEVYRDGETKPFIVDMRKVLKDKKSKDNVVLKTNDVIYVPPKFGRQRPSLLSSALNYMGPLAFLVGAF